MPLNPKPGIVAHPLGPVVYRVRPRRSVRSRLLAAVVATASLTLLSTAAWVTPDGSGLGSHRQLGLPPCTLVVLTGYPCPTCGMTTAFAHTVRGEFRSAFQAQPAGLLLALATMAAAGVSLSVVITGKVWMVNWYRVPPGRIPLWLVLLILAGWGYKLAVGWVSGRLPVR